MLKNKRYYTTALRFTQQYEREEDAVTLFPAVSDSAFWCHPGLENARGTQIDCLCLVYTEPPE